MHFFALALISGTVLLGAYMTLSLNALLSDGSGALKPAYMLSDGRPGRSTTKQKLKMLQERAWKKLIHDK